MRTLAWILVAFVAGCGSSATPVSSSSAPPSNDGNGGGVGTPAPGGGGTTPGGGGGGGSGGTSGGGGSGGIGGGGGGGGGPSACPTTPTVIGASFEPRGSDGAYIYGYGYQQIARIPVGGGAPQTVVGGIDTTIDFALLVAGGYVYWTVEPDSVHPSERMFRAAKAGGDQPTYLADCGLDIVADDAYVYGFVDWPGNGAGLVTVAQSDGRVRQEQIGGGGAAAGVDDQYVYFEGPGPNWPANVALYRVPKVIPGATGPEQVATWQRYGDSGPSRSASDGKSAFFWDFGRVVRVDFATGSSTLLYDPQRDVSVPSGDRPGQMAVDDTTVYWTATNDYVEPRYVLDAVDKDGHAPRTLYSGNVVGGHGVVIVGDSVYFNTGSTLYQQCKR